MKPLLVDLASGTMRTLTSWKVSSPIQWATKVALALSHGDRKSSLASDGDLFRRYYPHLGSLTANAALIKTWRPRVGNLEFSKREPANVISITLSHFVFQLGLSSGYKRSTSSVRLMMTTTRRFVPDDRTR